MAEKVRKRMLDGIDRVHKCVVGIAATATASATAKAAATTTTATLLW